jgi:hypothetical protein
MGKDLNSSKAAGDPKQPWRDSSEAIRKLVNGVLVSVGTVYLATGSILVTVIGAIVSITLAVLFAAARR